MKNQETFDFETNPYDALDSLLRKYVDESIGNVHITKERWKEIRDIVNIPFWHYDRIREAVKYGIEDGQLISEEEIKEKANNIYLCELEKDLRNCSGEFEEDSKSYPNESEEDLVSYPKFFVKEIQLLILNAVKYGHNLAKNKKV
ncbi:hypothetical protein HYV44_02610 [Candidatus Microgenomates bacterium]|nr:hypothetical protein [Candidatus Microgenomates bacterium]